MEPTREQLLAAIKLAAEDELFFNWKDWGFITPKDPMEGSHRTEVEAYLLCSDTYGYACADAEVVPWDEVEALWEVYSGGGGWPSLIDWVSARRGIMPLPKVQEAMDEYRRKHASASS